MKGEQNIKSEILQLERNIKIDTEEIDGHQNSIKAAQMRILKCHERIESLKWVLEKNE